MGQILNALKAKLKEQDLATDRYDYRCGLYDAIQIVKGFEKELEDLPSQESCKTALESYLLTKLNNLIGEGS